MELVPCRECRRHVGVGESACPFCHASLGASLPRRLVRRGGAVSRAAIFASAAACYTSASPTQQQQQQVNDTQQTQVEPPPDGDGFAKPPLDGLGVLRGRVLGPGQRPLAGVSMLVIGERGDEYHAVSDGQGRFVFRNLAPGNYRIGSSDGDDNPRHGRPPLRPTTVAAGQTQELDIYVQPYVPDNSGPCCKPYGAPPARRRVV